jgi:hypothetical protein
MHRGEAGVLERKGLDRPVWVEQTEDIIRGIRGVTGARVQAQDGEISEIHVSVIADPDGARPLKRYVRDIESAIFVKLGRKVDHKKISIVEDKPQAESSGFPINVENQVSVPKRLKITSVNLHTEAMQTHAQVILALGSVEALGTAVGPNVRLNRYRLTAAATLNAVGHFIADEFSFNLGDLSVVRMGRDDVVLVTVDFLSSREERSVSGSCVAKPDDVLYSVVCATLDAMNRTFEGLKTKEPMEYEIEPG